MLDFRIWTSFNPKMSVGSQFSSWFYTLSANELELGLFFMLYKYAFPESFFLDSLSNQIKSVWS